MEAKRPLVNAIGSIIWNGRPISSNALTLMKGGIFIASIEKHGGDTLYYIKHNMRELPPDKTPSNLEIDERKKDQNYSIISRGKNATEINRYRKQITKEIFKYNRKNLVQSVEVCITLPKDCPANQEKAFFEESYKYVVSTLPMREKCIFLAEVHADEGHIQKDGVTVLEGAKHLHIMYVPGVPDTKHDGYQYKLCADQLTKRAKLKEFHPNFQKWLDDAGIKATVNSGVTGGKNVSVAALKEMTKETGLSLEEIKTLQSEKLQLQTQVVTTEKQLSTFEKAIDLKDKIILELQSHIQQKDAELLQLHSSISVEKDFNSLKEQMHPKDTANEKLQERINELEKVTESQKQQLEKAQEKIQELQQKKTIEKTSSEKTWGNDSSWGTRSGWGNNDHTHEEEKTW